jgi:signal transduction histidine kinase/ActR/RegA family two-component response regulator
MPTAEANVAEAKLDSANAPGGDRRILVLAPRGRNSVLIERTLASAGVDSYLCADVQDLCENLQRPTGAAIVCEEAFTNTTLDLLVMTLGQQPPWSEIPMLVLTGGGRTTRSSLQIASALGPRGNVTLMERPVRILTLISAVHTALRARGRQYEVRDLLTREQSARSQAEAASRAKDQFLAALSHELRTPLNPVLMTVSAMLDDPRLPLEMREDIDLIKRNIKLESKLIDDLLDLTRIARGKLELHQEAVNLHALLDHAIRTCCESDITRKRIHVIANLEADEHFVWGDPPRLSQIFWNLIKNAVKFTPDDGTITITTWNDSDQSIVTTVSDTGIGMAPEATSRIFDAFEQADRSITRQFGGLGLGLAICRALVTLHGGTIFAESAGRGKGATFTVRLATAPGVQISSSHEENTTPSRDAELAVLLVEDHESTADVMARLLNGMGHRVTVAPDVATARRIFDNAVFDVLVSDLGLPDGSGLDLMRQLRGFSKIPAIAISGYGMEDDIRQSENAGFDAHLVKPIDVTILKSVIQRVTAGRS